MNSYKPLHYFFGEYVFETPLNVFSRLSNVLGAKRLSFWGCEAEGQKMLFRASLFHGEEIYKSAKEADIPIEIRAKNGFPFLFSKYRRRAGLILGFALGLVLMFYSQMFVWKINISGNKEMTVSEIETALSQCGIYVGSFIPEIDNRAYANRLLMNCPELSSAAISVNGNQVFVSVLEKTPMPDFIDKEGYYNVVASCDGVILDIDAAEGTAEVAKGDVVYKGQLLINSFIQRKNGTFCPTHARGTVYAAVKQSFNVEIPLERVMKRYTGNIKTKRVYEILGWEVPSISGIEAPYEYFDAVTAERWIKIFGFIEIPVKEYRVTYSEYIPETQTITEEYAEVLANEELDSFLNDLDLEMLECETEFLVDKEKGVCGFTANALLKQNIATEIALEINQSISERLPIPRE